VQRQPLGQLAVFLQSPGSISRRVTSKDFKLYEDTSPLRELDLSRSRGAVSQIRCNNKENIPPMSKSSKQLANSDAIVRPLPRGPLNTLNLSDHTKTMSEVVERERRTVIKKRIVKTYDAGKTVVQGTQKTTTVTTKIVSRPIIDDLKPALQSPLLKSWEFEIFQDNLEDGGMFDAYNSGYDAIMLDDCENKENEGPVAIINVENADKNNFKSLDGVGKEFHSGGIRNSED
jgi:hypothetical protein